MTTSRSFRLEAEDFNLKHGFREQEDAGFASSDGFIFTRPGSVAAAKAEFAGETGRYKVVIHYFDESDGNSHVRLKIGGQSDHFRMNDGDASNKASQASEASRVSFDEIKIEKGDAIKLNVFAHRQEKAAVDFIEFIPIGGSEQSPSRPAPAQKDAPPARKVTPPAQTRDDGDDLADAGAGKLDAFERQVIALTNEIREKAGLSTLRFNSDLGEAAEAHSRDMAENNFFSHRGSDGDGHIERAMEAGYDSRYVGENIAAGYDTPEQVVKGWMRSSGHRENIMNPKYNEIGVGFVDDGDSRYGEYWTQNFGWDSSLV